MSSEVQRAIHDPQRLAAVHATGLLDTPPEEAFDRLARLARTVLGTPLAFVTLVDDERSYWKSCIGVPAGGPRQNTVEESFCQYVVGSGEALVARDAATHPVTKDNPSIELMGVAAWAGMPLRAPGGQVLGSFCVVDTEPREWTDEQISSLAALSEAAAGEIALRSALRSTSEAARTLRQVLLPPKVPSVKGLDVAAGHIAALDGFGVLGDFYDVFEAAPDRWVIAIGDVRGHGPEAAETAASVRWSIRALAREMSDPVAVMERVNDLLHARDDEDAPHVTALLATFAHDGTQGTEGLDVDVVCSGHPPPLLWREDGGMTHMAAAGRPLGLFEDAGLSAHTVTLDPGDSLVLVTDGAMEARDVAGEQLGEHGLKWALAAMTTAPVASSVVLQVLGAVRRHQHGMLRDDVAALVVGVPRG